jgi:hypothetical protein
MVAGKKVYTKFVFELQFASANASAHAKAGPGGVGLGATAMASLGSQSGSNESGISGVGGVKVGAEGYIVAVGGGGDVEFDFSGKRIPLKSVGARAAAAYGYGWSVKVLSADEVACPPDKK